eukprot:489606_1
MTVFHGLNCIMSFDKFTAFFGQPVSTTISIRTAQQFADQKGIILVLKSALIKLKGIKININKIPKYLSVSWMSCFPNEDEKLFYGSFVAFKIVNIIESNTMKGHSKELIMFNKFQNMLQNENVKWNINNKKDIKRMNALNILIKKLQTNNNNNNNDINNKKDIIEEIDKNDKNDKNAMSSESQEAIQKLNPLTWPCNPRHAKFYVIKSFGEDDVHKSIKYNLWCSTERGNRKLDEAFNESKRINNNNNDNNDNNINNINNIKDKKKEEIIDPRDTTRG